MESDDENRVGCGGRGNEKRAHHNALERKRRDHIKESFAVLRDQVPTISGAKASRTSILNTARDYIHHMRVTNCTMEHEVEEIRKINELMEEQVRLMELAIEQGTTAANQKL